ncbi:MAG: hypothetical protein K2I03_04695 [Lachnospiraceae bacterium]|nr:hypothetical protein [Lachnospiraceae bacterium]MDE6233055.1 hypothetical protein [Lachnospiraceae bacterium]MDE6252667.1 hypothetical protein [Lachnospiraceae bacterium]
MNRDFHYEGTYAAAVIAGFTPESAADIAWAAQTVDECTKKNVDKFYPYLNRWAPVFTCQSVTENVGEEISSLLSYETSSALQLIRSIWIPFHFLPGNIDGHFKYNGTEPLGSERDMRDFLCMCGPNSDLVLQMIQRAVSVFSHCNELEKKKYLIMIGILMHVLADTWAHQYFSGTPNYFVNEVKDRTVLEPSKLPEEFETETTPFGVTDYSVSYLGHGRAGHFPDYGCMSYHYHPNWKAEGQYIIKNGPEDFSCAFEQMEWALRCFRTGNRFTIPEQNPGEKPWLLAIDDVIKTTKADQSGVWRRQMADFVDYHYLPDYKFEGENHKMTLFQTYAREHRAFVMGYLQSNGNILNVQ